MSASNYTRGHHHATHSTDAVLRWLEWHGRRVINGSTVLRLEMSKAARLMLLSGAGFATPQTVLAVGRSKLMDADQGLRLSPFIVKPNQGGKGFGVRLFGSPDELDRALQADDFPQAIDDVWLVQKKIDTTDDFITRVEFIGGRFHYAVRVFGGGTFELCPADVCEVELDHFCPADANENQPIANTGPRFEIDLKFDDPLIHHLERFQGGIRSLSASHYAAWHKKAPAGVAGARRWSPGRQVLSVPGPGRRADCGSHRHG